MAALRVSASLTSSTPSSDGKRPPPDPKRRRSRWLRVVHWLAYSTLPLAAVWTVAVLVPVPIVDTFVANQIATRLANQLSCPGDPTGQPKIIVKGDRLLLAALSRRLSEVDLSLPDVALKGVRHAAVTAALRGVSQTESGVTRVGSVDATIVIGFADLPTPSDGSTPAYHRTPDGALGIDVTVPPEAASNVAAKLFLKMNLRGETVSAVPQRLRIFGHTLPASRVIDLTGGTRIYQLPHLPDGVTYKSFTPKKDGLHVALGGVVTTPLDTLPTTVGGRTVSYSAENGLLGILTSAPILPLVNSPLTIYAAPRLAGQTLTLVPQSVTILGANRPPTDSLAALVLAQVNREDLVRRLPDLPAGVRYQAISVDAEGIKITLDGVTVRPFSDLPLPNDVRVTGYGVEDGLLTVSVQAGTTNAMPVSIYAKPVIDGRELLIAPKEITVFDTVFPAQDVLDEVAAPDTAYLLPSLPANLAYLGVEVLSHGLRIHLSGRDVTLSQGMLGIGGCG